MQNMCQQQICQLNATNNPHAHITQYAYMGRNANVCATYEFAPINDVARIPVHR